MAFYFSYGSNMSMTMMKNVRNTHPLRSQKSTLLNYKIIMNMPGPNFIEPGFANITPSIGFKVEGVVHEISDDDLKKIIGQIINFYRIFKREELFSLHFLINHSKI